MKVELSSVTQPARASQSVEEYLVKCTGVLGPSELVDYRAVRRVVNYFIASGNWEPFRGVSFGFEIETTVATANWLTQLGYLDVVQPVRTGKVVEPENVCMRFKTAEGDHSSAPGSMLHERVEVLAAQCVQLYRELIRSGVETEDARMSLPLSTKCTLIVRGTLADWVRFTRLKYTPQVPMGIKILIDETRREVTVHCPNTASALGWPIATRV